MRDLLKVLVCVVLIALFAGPSVARKVHRDNPIRFMEAPTTVDLPPDLQSLVQNPALSSAAADTFHLAWFSFGNGTPDPQGWTSVDITATPGPFFHVADPSELNGGSFGALVPLEGSQSLWCGAAPSSAPPLCGYVSLPGYGNGWQEYFTSKTFNCDSVQVYYKVRWDSEAGYDRTRVEWYDGASWNILLVDGNREFYDFDGSLTECLMFGTVGGSTQIRFRFNSDGAWSDEDGLWPTDGAILVDSLTVECLNEVPPNSGNWVVSSTYYEDFEDEAPGALVTNDGVWTSSVPPGFGDFASLYPGISVTQEDPCFTNFGFLWGFFDDPVITAYLCHTPNPLPGQGAMRYGPNADGLYLWNQIVSPEIPVTGSGNQWFLTFRVYRDLPLDNAQFYRWRVRDIVGGCPQNWEDDNFVFFGDQKDWLQTTFDVSPYISGNGSHVQISLAAVDMCGFWCGIFSTGACHSHAPLFDDVHLKRVNVLGPQFSVRHIDLFQDTFAEDGTLTGHARADAANDIAPAASPTILPGDSLTMTASGVGTDPNTGVGPAAYLYVAVWPKSQPGKTPADLEAPETRSGVGKRWPLVGTVDHNGVTWACFRMDSAITTAGATVQDRWCVDLNDWVFTPCDTIGYVIAADDGLGNTNYFSRRGGSAYNAPWGGWYQSFGYASDFVTDNLWEALDSPMEFQVLPGAGWKRGGEILYVDDADDRAGPPQLFFDTAASHFGLAYEMDRFDVLGPSSNVSNSLASRVKNAATQINDCYQVIIWSSGNLSAGTIGDGSGNPEKSNDFALLFQFLDTKTNNPGLYITGDDIAEEWVTLSGAGAINLRSIYMNFNLVNGDHVAAGEPVTPLLAATDPCFISLGIPNTLYAYGGCPVVNDFDVLETTGASTTAFPYPNGAGDAAIKQETPNSGGSTARVILSGFGYETIRNDDIGWPLARTTHLRNILVCLQTLQFIPEGIGDGVDRDFLSHAAPNPFNPETKIRYGVRERGQVTLRVYNVAGQLVRTLVNEVKTPIEGGFEVTWDGRDDRGTQVSTGVYFYKLSTRGFSQTKKMVLLK